MGDEIKREEYLTFLDSHTHAVLVGSEGKGKTKILLQYMQRLKEPSVYVNFKTIGMSPDQFAIDYIGSLIFSYSNCELSTLPKYSDIEYLQTLDVRGKEIIKELVDELAKKKPSNEKILTLAFSFPERLGVEVLLIDEFQEIESLNNYKNISNASQLFMNSIQGKVKISSTKNLSLPIPSLEVKNFSLIESKKLVSESIYDLTQGFPLAIGYFSLTSTKIDYISSLINIHHPLYQNLLRILEEKLSDARGASLLRVVMKVLALNKKLSLSDLAEKINRSAPVTKSLLERLMEVDLVGKEGKKFFISEKVLSDFCYYYFLGAAYEKVDEKLVREVMKDE